MATVNRSLESSGVVPLSLKTALITLLVKKKKERRMDRTLRSWVTIARFPISHLPAIFRRQWYSWSGNSASATESAPWVIPKRLPWETWHWKQQYFKLRAHVYVTSDMDLALDAGDGILLALLNLSAAVDTIDHDVRIARLEHSCGISGTLLNWFISYLLDAHKGAVWRGGLYCIYCQTTELSTGVTVGPTFVYHPPTRATSG